MTNRVKDSLTFTIGPSGHRMVRDHGVHRSAGSVESFRDSFVPALSVRAGSKRSHVVDGLELFEVTTQSWSERIVHREHARPEGVTAHRRQLDGLQDGREWRPASVAHVRVPLCSVRFLIAFPRQDDDIVELRMRRIRVMPDAEVAQRLSSRTMRPASRSASGRTKTECSIRAAWTSSARSSDTSPRSGGRVAIAPRAGVSRVHASSMNGD